MARKHLIHYHTSNTSLPSAEATEGIMLGEIAVQHNATAPKLVIATVTGDSETARFAEFIDKNAVVHEVTAVTSVISGDVADLQTIVGTGLTSGVSLTSAVQSLQGGTLASVSGDNTTYIHVSASAKDANFNQVITATAVTSDVSAATAAADGLAIAYDVKQEIKKVDDKLGAGVDSSNTVTSQLATITGDVNALKSVTSGYTTGGSIKSAIETAQSTADSAKTTADSALQSISKGTDGNYVTTTVGTKTNNDQTVGVALTVQAVASADASLKGVAEASDVKTYVDTEVGGVAGNVADIQSQLAGFDTTSGAVQTYVDNKVASAITSVYRVKGTKATSADLPLTDNTKGDVWNVTAATGSTPAGTNYVWVLDAASASKREEGWDALGGTIDLSPYQTVSGFIAYTSTTETTLSGLRNDVDTVSGSVNTLAGVLSGYSSVGSVSADVKTAKDAAAKALTGVTVTGDSYVSLTAGAEADQAIAISAATTTHAIDSATADTDGLATAYAVKNYVTGITNTLSTNINTVSGTAAANATAITGLQNIVGTGFSQTTLTDKIAGLEAGTYAGLATGSSSNIVLTVSGIDSTTHKETISASAVTAALSGSTNGLVLASDARDKFSGITGDITSINTALGTGFDSGKTVASEITRLDGAMLTGITSGTADEYVTLTVGNKSGKSQTVTVDTKIGDIATATAATEGLATAYDVKSYVTGVTNGISTAVIQNSEDIATINSKLGDGFTSGSTVTSQLAAVKTTADGAVQDVTVTGVTGVSVTESSAHTATIDFTKMVIDCGIY